MKRTIAVATYWLVIIALILSPLNATSLGRTLGAEPFPPPETTLVEESELSDPAMHAPPAPGNNPQIELARARQAMQDELTKYLAYWGPRYQLSLGEVAVDGEWAHGVAEWQSEARVMSDDAIHILARRSSTGLWQAEMPDEYNSYTQWLENIPEHLISLDLKLSILASIRNGPLLPSSQFTRDSTNDVPESDANDQLSEQPVIDYLIPESDLSQQAKDAIASALSNWQYDPPSNGRFSILSMRWETDWALVTLTTADLLSPPVPGQATSVLNGVLASLLLVYNHNEWQAAVDGDANVIPLLDLIPETELSSGAKRALFSGSSSLNEGDNTVDQVYNNYKFPWPSDRPWHNHGGWHVGAPLAIDFDVVDNTNSDVLAAAPGYITSFIQCTPSDHYIIRITTENTSERMTLIHLSGETVRAQGLHLGDFVYQGRKLGQMAGAFYDSNSDSCGIYSSGTHLHVEFPTKPFTIDNKTYTDTYWYDGVYLYSTNSSSADTTRPDGDITSPTEGAVITSSTVYLGGWAQDNDGGSGLNHAHFTAYYNGDWYQVGPDFTSSPFGFNWDMCSAGVPSGPVTIGLDIWDNAGNVANSPRGVRHFTKNYDCTPPPTCSPNSDQISIYADPGFAGACFTLGVGNYPDPSYLGPVGNDNVASIRVGSNVQAILFEHAGYEGRSETFTADDSNLSDNQYIHNEEVSSVKVQWRTVPPAAPALSTPANGSTPVEGASITLTWNASPTASEYYVEFWGGPAGTLNSGWLSNTYWSIGSQWAGYTYSWHVKARNSAGDSVWSATWTFTVRPAAPTNLTAQTASCSQVNLYWTDNSGNEEGYKIYRNGALIAQVGMNVTSYQSTGLSENTTYLYFVKAYRGTIESYGSDLVYITTPSCAPSLPDLRPYVPSGYTYPVTPASIPGTSVVDNLLIGQDTYFDWFFANTGTATASGSFYVELWVDDIRYIRYPYSNFGAGGTGGFADWMIPIDTPGWHKVSLITDPDNVIVESDEDNNLWYAYFYWSSSVPVLDYMEDGQGAWTATGLWHVVDEYTSPYPQSHSWSHSWWYGQDATGDYDTGVPNSGSLTSPSFYIPSSGYYLRFWYWYSTETQAQTYDQRWVQISVNGSAFTNVLQLYDDHQYIWLHSQYIDLSAYSGDTIQVRFYFDSIDGAYNYYRGWYIDDVSITTDPPPSCDDYNEPNDTTSQATDIAYIQIKSGDICPNGDYDYFTFYGQSGDQAVIDINAMQFGSLLDSYIFLLDSDGTTILGENDDEIPGELLDSKLGYVLPHDGDYYVRIRAWDHIIAGSADHYYDVHLYQDTQSPTAQITSPVEFTWMNPDTETVTITASDSQSGVQRVEFLWHNSDWGVSDWVWLGADNDGSDGWSLEFDTFNQPEQYGGAFYIWAFDRVGNWTGAGVWNLGIDRTPPVTSAFAMPAYFDAPFLDFNVYWQGSDNLSGIAAYDVQVRDGSDGVWIDLLTDTTNTYYHYIGEEGHTYYFRTRARDWAGNQSDFAGGDGDAQYNVTTCPTPPDSFEADGTAVSARWIYPDTASQTHTFHVAQDVDWVKFSANAGTAYTLATTNTGGHADTVLSLYDPTGTILLAFNDDYPDAWPASRIDWQPTVSGVYYLMVNHWDPWAYGCTTEYGLTVSTRAPFPDTMLNYLPFIIRLRDR